MLRIYAKASEFVINKQLNGLDTLLSKPKTGHFSMTEAFSKSTT